MKLAAITLLCAVCGGPKSPPPVDPEAQPTPTPVRAFDAGPQAVAPPSIDADILAVPNAYLEDPEQPAFWEDGGPWRPDYYDEWKQRSESAP